MEMSNKRRTNILSGLADEAGADIETQIAVHRELGWPHMELRLVDGKNACGQLDDEEFGRAARAIEESGMIITCFASAIGNWSRHIEGDFGVDLAEMRTAVRRMNRLGVRYIRTMSWLGTGVDETEWRREVIRRYRELVKIAADGGVIIAHENCTGCG